MARTGIRSSAIVKDNNKILLIHRIKDGDEYWTFPGGGVEEGETWEETVIRELKEETNLNVTSLKLAFMDQTYEGGNEHPFYLCRTSGESVLGGEEKDKNSTENFYELQWIKINEVEKYNLLPETAKYRLLNYYKNELSKKSLNKSSNVSTTREEFESVLKKVSRKLTPSELAPSKPKT